MRFTELDLSEPLQQAIRALGYEETTPIQTQAIPPACRDATSSVAPRPAPARRWPFFCQRWNICCGIKAKTKNPRVVVLEPTRELAIQVAGEARKLAARTSLRVVSVYGGAGMRKQTDKLRRGVDIVVATPGRLMDHMRRKNVNFAGPADPGVGRGRPHAGHGLSARHQTDHQSHAPPAPDDALFGHDAPDDLGAGAPVSARPGAASRSTWPSLPRRSNRPSTRCPSTSSVHLLLAMLEQMEVDSMLVFTRTKQEADIVTRQLREAKIAVACIHGDFKQRERISALEGFRSGKHRVLVATNIAARGLDVEGISHVINYDVPDQAEDYVHRIGRTARAEADGDAITLVTPDDEPLIHRIEYLLGRKIERKTLPGFDYDVPTPSWAKPSAKTLMRQVTKSQSLADRWRSMS